MATLKDRPSLHANGGHPMTGKQQARAIEALTRVWPLPRKCPVCGGVGGKGWSLGMGGVVGVQAFQDGMMLPGAPITVMLPVACCNCGLTIFFNAIILGLIGKDGSILE